MPAAATTDGPTLLTRAQAIVPALRERRVKADELRRVPDETMVELRQSELLKAAQPSRYGGLELGLHDIARLIATLARGCGSTAWVFGVFCDHAVTLGMFALEAQEDVWRASPDALVSSGLAPSGSATRVEGGYRLDGRWSFSSGCDHAQWFIVVSFVPPGPKMFLLPKKDVGIVDNWHVMGLSATGSKDLVIEDVFVPDHRVLDNSLAAAGTGPGAEVNPHPLYRTPRLAAVPFCLAAPALGMAERAREIFVESMSQRSSRGFTLAEQQSIQLRLAEASAEIDAADLLMQRDLIDTMETMASSDPLTMAQRARNRRDMAYCVQLATRAVDRLFAATGGAELFSTGELQRIFRDVHAVSAHLALSWDVAGTTYGRVSLGLPPTHPMI